MMRAVGQCSVINQPQTTHPSYRLYISMLSQAPAPPPGSRSRGSHVVMLAAVELAAALPFCVAAHTRVPTIVRRTQCAASLSVMLLYIPMASGSAFLSGDCIPSSRKARVSTSGAGGKPKKSRSSRILSQNSSRLIAQSTRCSIFSISEHAAHFPSVSLSCFLV